MSKLIAQNRSDELASVFLHKRLTGDFGEYFDFQPHGEKDNTPDTDGFLRLRRRVEGNKYSIENLPISYFYQQKGTKTPLTAGHIYNCKKDVISYCIETNLPTLLFVVYIKNNVGISIYYKYFDSLTRKHFKQLLDANPRKRTLPVKHMEKLEMDENFINFYGVLREKGRINQLNDLPNELETLTLSVRDSLTVITSVLYLGKTLSVLDFPQKINSLFGYPINEIKFVIRKLKSMNIVESSSGFYALRDMEVGRESEAKRFAASILTYAIDDLDIDAIVDTFSLNETEVHARLSSTNVTSARLEERQKNLFEDVLEDVNNL